MADKRLILPRITKAKLDKQKKLKAFCESNRKTTHEFQIVNIRDKYADLLPDICPERFSYFRYIGFRVVSLNDPKKVEKRGMRITLTLTLTHQNEPDEPFTASVSQYFKGGSYYFQSISMAEPGVHELCITGKYEGVECLQPFRKRIVIHEVLDLNQCPQLLNGPYGTLMKFMDDRIAKKTDDELRDENVLMRELATLAVKNLGKGDLKWWFKTYFSKKDEGEALKYRLVQSFWKDGERKHKRKQNCPSRSGTEKEQRNYFEGRVKERRRRCRGQLRIFTLEPLASGTTLMLFNTKQLKTQMAKYNLA